MYKTTIFRPKLGVLSNVLNEAPPQIEEYVNNFEKEGWELVSVTNYHPVGFLFVWKKK